MRNNHKFGNYIIFKLDLAIVIGRCDHVKKILKV